METVLREGPRRRGTNRFVGLPCFSLTFSRTVEDRDAAPSSSRARRDGAQRHDCLEGACRPICTRSTSFHLSSSGSLHQRLAEERGPLRHFFERGGGVGLRRFRALASSRTFGAGTTELAPQRLRARESVRAGGARCGSALGALDRWAARLSPAGVSGSVGHRVGPPWLKIKTIAPSQSGSGAASRGGTGRPRSGRPTGGRRASSGH